VNTPTGRALALSDNDSPSEPHLVDGGVPRASLGAAFKLLTMRAKILTQKKEAEKCIFNLHVRALSGSQGDPADIQSLKFRIGALRGLVDDLKKITDELDPPPTPEAEIKKVMTEYDGLVLRPVNTPVGRVLALFPPEEGWSADNVRKVFPADSPTAVALLEKRGQIRTQKVRAEQALTNRAQALKKKEQAKDSSDAEFRARVDDEIRTHEHEAKVATTALRGLIGDLKKQADEIDPPKGK